MVGGIRNLREGCLRDSLDVFGYDVGGALTSWSSDMFRNRLDNRFPVELCVLGDFGGSPSLACVGRSPGNARKVGKEPRRFQPHISNMSVSRPWVAVMKCSCPQCGRRGAKCRAEGMRRGERRCSSTEFSPQRLRQALVANCPRLRTLLLHRHLAESSRPARHSSVATSDAPG